MTYEPQALSDLQEYMHIQTGLPYNALGTVPDPDHDGGYHCGWDLRHLDDKGVLHDYSWQESSRDWNHKSDACRAFDCGSFDRLREMSIWLVDQCKAGAPDTLDFREIIYTPDGVNVLRWDRLGVRSSGDSSHLSHTHFSFFADAEDNDKVSPFQRFFEGGGMATQAERNVNYMIQNGILGIEEPEMHIPAESGFPAQTLTNPLATVLKALVTGTDANIPAYVNIPARTWVNTTAATLARIESKLDQLLAMPPGSVDPAVIRAAVRAELDDTQLKRLSA
jgi:hypothetical protein